MFGIMNFWGFLIAGIILNITPGADTMYILGRSIAQGKRSGIISALGIASGALLHCILAALGLSIILAKSTLAFDIIKYTGAAYLLYLGVGALLAKKQTAIQLHNEGSHSKQFSKIYVSGMLTNVLNPKVSLFFLAFLPQFIQPEYMNSYIPFLVLGLTFVCTGTLWCLLLALFSAKFANSLRRNPKIKFTLDKITGIIFIILAVQLALIQQ